MKSIFKITCYIVIFFIAVQIIIGNSLLVDFVYDGRPVYDVIKDDINTYDLALKAVKKIIDREKLEDYAILIGDSVAYGSPGPSNTTISYYLNEKAKAEGKSFRVFNLAFPAMYAGDYYAVLLKMQKYGISNKHVIININYPGFAIRDSTDLIWAAYWLKEDLIKDGIETEYKMEPTSFKKVKNKILRNIPIFAYRGFIQYRFNNSAKSIFNGNSVQEPVQPWTEKPYLYEYMQDEFIQKSFRDKPFDMDTNPQAVFLDKIIQMQEGNDTIIFMAAANDLLLSDATSKPGYKENIEKVRSFFKNKDVTYIDFNGNIDYNLFSDHLHMTADGYKYMAEQLWNEVIKWDIH